MIIKRPHALSKPLTFHQIIDKRKPACTRCDPHSQQGPNKGEWHAVIREQIDVTRGGHKKHVDAAPGAAPAKAARDPKATPQLWMAGFWILFDYD